MTFEPQLPNQDVYEVRIYDNRRNRRLVATIEIVSPSNKHRSETRGTFVAQVAALLKHDICVSIVDVVSQRLRPSPSAAMVVSCWRRRGPIADPPPSQPMAFIPLVPVAQSPKVAAMSSAAASFECGIGWIKVSSFQAVAGFATLSAESARAIGLSLCRPPASTSSP